MTRATTEHGTVSIHDHETTHTIWLAAGQPAAVLDVLARATRYALPPAAFAADDYAAAIVRAGKGAGGGDVRISDNAVRHADVRWHYDVWCIDARIQVVEHDLHAGPTRAPRRMAVLAGESAN